ncbi:MAG: amidophosphoribosyltransferase [Mycoplasmoidaceae bacterium]
MELNKLTIFEPKIKEECGVFGVINSKTASHDIYLGLHSLQHRGQEASGIATLIGDNEYVIKKIGPIINTFDKTNLDFLKGECGIGHVRYSTFGSTEGYINVQPFVYKTHKYTYLTCHNGNLTNANELRIKLEKMGSVFFSSSDSEILGHLINRSKKSNFIDKIKDSLSQMVGAFSFLILKDDCIYGCRDLNGIRPLSFGKKDGAYYFASETVALDIVRADLIRDVKPGEIVEINLEGKISSSFYVPEDKTHHNLCAMEYIYFSRPDSNIDNKNIHNLRVSLGKQLALEHYIDADVVIGVPDSSLSSAIGYSDISKIPYDIGLIKNRYVARSFILAGENRDNVVRVKLNPNKAVLEGKRVILVDDSIVRGTTMGIITKLIYDAGAKEIHLRIAAPKLKWPCFYGVDIKSRKELALYNNSKEEYLKSLKYVNSLEFLSLDGLQRALGMSSKEGKLCTSCFTGNYITKLYSNKKDK